eukprot:5588493-Pleurochrysis_carterae.AAC.2
MDWALDDARTGRWTTLRCAPRPDARARRGRRRASSQTAVDVRPSPEKVLWVAARAHEGRGLGRQKQHGRA